MAVRSKLGRNQQTSRPSFLLTFGTVWERVDEEIEKQEEVQNVDHPVTARY